MVQKILHSWRVPTALVLASISLALTTVTTAGTAGTLTVVQNGAAREAIANWMLIAPNGIRTSGHEISRTVLLGQPGTYRLTVDVPGNAEVSMILLRDGIPMATLVGSSHILELHPAYEYRLELSYRYRNTVTVTSSPRGMPFILSSPNKHIQFAGTTPATYENLPPVAFTVQYATHRQGCIPPKPQQRIPNDHREIVFVGRYNCVAAEKQENTESPDEHRVESPVRMPRISNSSTQNEEFGEIGIEIQPEKTELLPGGTAVFTLHVRNRSRTTKHALNVGMHFDASKLHIASQLAHGGDTQGDGIAYWHIPLLYAGQSWQTQVTVRLIPGTILRTPLTISARVSGEEIDPQAPHLVSTATIGKPAFPVTGNAIEMSILILVLSLSAGIVYSLQYRRS